MENLTRYVKDSYNELAHKVTWPTPQNLIEATIAVLVASLLFSLLIFGMDAVSKFLLDTFIYGSAK